MGEGAPESLDLAELARAVRQRLEVNRAFGWEVPLSRKRLRPGASAAVGGQSAPEPAAGSEDPPPPSLSWARDPSERLASEARLQPLREEVAACTRCILCRGRTRTVFGAGDPTAMLMFVGEAPGFEEDRQGEPFVGKAGQLLNDIIRAMGLRREQVYIANVIKCRPPNNRVPDPAEVGSCAGYLERQIDTVRPQVLVALGAVAAKALLGTELSMARLRSRFHDYRGIPVMPTYHPAYLLRNPADKRKVWEDIQLVMARLGLRPPRRQPAPKEGRRQGPPTPLDPQAGEGP